MNWLLLIIVIVQLCPTEIVAQLNDNTKKIKEEYDANKRRYKDKNKILKKKDKIFYLTDYHYRDSIFPNDFILKFKNLEELRISSGVGISRRKPLNYNNFKTIKFDTLKLQKLKSLKIIRFYGFDLKQFPIELSNIPNLETLAINYTTLDSLPEGIEKFRQLKSLELQANCIEYVSPSVAKMENLEILDLSHNKLTSIPISLVDAIKIKDLHISNEYGYAFQGYNFNEINYYDDLEIEKLKMLLFHSKVHIFVRNCDEGNYVREQIDKDLRKKKLVIVYKVFDCTGVDQFK